MHLATENTLTRTADKAGVVGSIVSAMGCAACFPAIGSLGAAIGLGFLTQYESVLIHYVLPLFALVGLGANIVAGLRHRNWPRMILGMIGPLLVLAAALLMAFYGIRAEWLLYPGRVLMVAVAIWDLASPPAKTRLP
jgi:mercuric ion transport protein